MPETAMTRQPRSPHVDAVGIAAQFDSLGGSGDGITVDALIYDMVFGFEPIHASDQLIVVV